MKDTFQCYSNAAVITPSDTGVITPNPWALLVTGGTGAVGVKVDTVGGQVGVTLPLIVGQNIIPVIVTRVYATGTTLGTGGAIVGLW